MRAMGQRISLKMNSLRTVIGTLLVVAGGLLFLDQFLKTGWLSLVILPAVGIFLYLWGIRVRHAGTILAGGLIAAVGAGMISAWGAGIQVGDGGLGVTRIPHTLIEQAGLVALFTGIGWGLVVLTTAAVTPRPLWWALIPGGVLGGLGGCLLFTNMHWTDFVLYLAVGTGLPLLFWGLTSRMIGLVIPGCLVTTIGGGVYTAWNIYVDANTLVQTGIMLIWFALGWVLITAGGKVIMHQYLWWPLIPGGILAMVGMGLYIGGDPKHALGFIGNTGSIALVILGLYLLLMRKGIHH
jgi:hypothetical protein